MLLRAIGTGFGAFCRKDGGKEQTIFTSVAFEVGRAQDTQVSCAYFPKQNSHCCHVGDAVVALVVDESACVVHRRFSGDAGTSPSPIGRISKRRPDWRNAPERNSWGNFFHYDEWIVTPVKYRGWMFIGGGASHRAAEIREAMSKLGLPELTKRVGRQK